jgi:hypothetical protein
MATFIPSKGGLYYLAGPMSNIPQFNYPAFYRIAGKLREMGFEIRSPAEMDTPAEQEAAMASPDGNVANFTSKSGSTWGDILAKDVKLISDVVDGIIAMPTWYKSKGARLEIFVAHLCKKPVWIFDELSGFYEIDPMDFDAGILGYGTGWDLIGKEKEEQKPVEAVTKRA